MKLIWNVNNFPTSFQICGTNRPFVVTSAKVSTDDKGNKTLNVLLQYVDDVDKIEGANSKKKTVDNGSSSSQFANVVEWISLTESSNSTFKLDRVRRYVFYGALVKLIEQFGRKLGS